jgi:dihydrofolate reductase
MEGGTIFYFVTDGIHAALEHALEVAGDRDVKIGGGVSTVRQYLEAGLIDEAHFAFSPVMLGKGEAMFEGLDLSALGYRVVESVTTERAMHVVLGRREPTSSEHPTRYATSFASIDRQLQRIYP